MSKFINSVFDKFRQEYNELTTFLTALTCLLLALTHPDFRFFYFNFFATDTSFKGDEIFILFGLAAFIGFALSVYHVFTKRKKNFIEVTVMSIFIMGANGFSGILAGIELLPKQLSVFAFFPLWNIFTGLFLLYQIGRVDFQVTDENATIPELIAGSATLLLVYGLAEFKLHLSWAMTFSLVIYYSSIAVFLIKWLKKIFYTKVIINE